MKNLILLQQGYNFDIFGRRFKVPLRFIYGVVAFIVPIIVPVILIPFVPKTVYINKV